MSDCLEWRLLSQQSLPQIMSLQLRSRCQEMLSLVESLKKKLTRLTEFSGICLVYPRIMLTFNISQRNLDLCFEKCALFSSSLCIWWIHACFFFEWEMLLHMTHALTIITTQLRRRLRHWWPARCCETQMQILNMNYRGRIWPPPPSRLSHPLNSSQTLSSLGLYKDRLLSN